MTTWKLECSECPTKAKVLCWDYELPGKCPECGASMYPESGPANTILISTDDIPGGVEIRHGLCNEDGTPRRYYSKTDIRREANRRGLTQKGDTPKPYRVSWEGKREEE